MSRHTLATTSCNNRWAALDSDSENESVTQTEQPPRQAPRQAPPTPCRNATPEKQEPADTAELQSWIDEHGWNAFETPTTLRAWLTLRNWTLAQIPTLEEATNYLYAHTTQQIANAEQEEAELWSQPFAQNLEEFSSDHYNTSNMTDDEFGECMTWLLERGWRVDEPVSRTYVHAEPDTLPPRQWNRVLAPLSLPLLPNDTTERTATFPFPGSVARVRCVTSLTVDMSTATVSDESIDRASLDKLVAQRTPRDSNGHSVCLCIPANHGLRAWL